ncbi:MAG: glutathione S-transferase family protein [Pseudomonadota bacterium]|nr:glutathione S-transferase family protein [Pseudomonadota bacterium]
MSDITLYSAQVCPFAQRTRLGLLEKGVDFRLVEIDLDSPPEWFDRISPYGKVPVLQRGDDLVWESAIINEYLEEVHPQPPLLPKEPGRRAYARFWIDFANVRFVPWFYKSLLEQDPARQRKRLDEFRDHVLFMENAGMGHPNAGRYWLGDALTLVDLAFYPFFERLPVLEHYRGLGLPAECRRLAAWWEAMRERDSVRKIIHSPEFYLRRYAKYADGSVQGSTAQDMRSI